MPDKSPATRMILEGELARLRRGQTVEHTAELINKCAGVVRHAELHGCCYGTAHALSTVTGARMEAYQHPKRIEVPESEYLALKKAASEIMRNTTKTQRRVTARRRTSLTNTTQPERKKAQERYDVVTATSALGLAI